MANAQGKTGGTGLAKKVWDTLLDKALSPEVITWILPTTLVALVVALRQKLELPVPLWVAIIIGGTGFATGYWVSQRRARRGGEHPTDTVRVFPRRSEWSFGYRSQREFREDKPATAALHFRFEITNVTDVPVRLVDVEVSLGWFRDRRPGWVATRQADGQLFSSQHYIEPQDTTESIADFSIEPPPRATSRLLPLRGTVFLRDQWGNRHKVKRVVFAPPRPPSPTPSGPSPERVHTITDPIEKDVASVLKAEIERYRGAGSRSRGLLGSVKSRQEGREVDGIATEWRRAGAAENQSIFHSTALPVIVSDNAEALTALYSRLTKEDEKDKFVQALLKRTERDSEYAEVAYLIALVLFRVGAFERFLPVAKERLQGDNGFGFGEVLRMLDALLRSEHSVFSSSLLDALEAFIEGLPENEVSRIRERLFAIRAHRVRGGSVPPALSTVT